MTSENHITILIWAFVLIFFYGALVRGFFVLAQPWRMRMAQLGAELVESGVDEKTKREIAIEIDTNFNSVWSWLAAVLIIPATLKWLWQRANGIEIEVPDPKSKLSEFRGLSLLTSLSNSPLALGLFAVQIALVSIFVRSAVTIAELLQIMDSFHHSSRNKQRLAAN